MVGGEVGGHAVPDAVVVGIAVDRDDVGAPAAPPDLRREPDPVGQPDLLVGLRDSVDRTPSALCDIASS